MFKRMFGKEEDEEEVFETVDPVLEQRRKEKFSTPLIYNDDAAEKKVEAEIPKKGGSLQKAPVSIDTSYRMSEIISPMTGVKKSTRQEVKSVKPKFHKPKKDTDELIPIISPFYGSTDIDTSEITLDHPQVIQEEMSVENNLRNIAHIVAEEKDQLKIIEERTGEFKLDFQKQNEESFIDEIDDSMSLDELMSLYEKKFKD